MQDVAIERGGKCLSKEYIQALVPLNWQCKKGHTWDAKPQMIMNGSWCPQCVKQDYLQELKEVAESRGGKCLSTEYIDGSVKLKWQCSSGHIWEAKPGNVKIKSWCPTCQKVTIDDMQQFAKKNGGKCLSEKYIHSHVHLEWECKKGHIWKAVPSAIKQGEWCRLCAFKRSADKQRDTIENMQLIAISRGGKCLSKKYINGALKLKWECELGHTWKATAQCVKQKGTWCPVCSMKISKKYLVHTKDTIENMQQIAISRKGKCLSKKYVYSNVKLKWECEFGHTWSATPSGVKSGNWCPTCGIEKSKKQLMSWRKSNRQVNETSISQ